MTLPTVAAGVAGTDGRTYVRTEIQCNLQVFRLVPFSVVKRPLAESRCGATFWLVDPSESPLHRMRSGAFGVEE